MEGGGFTELWFRFKWEARINFQKENRCVNAPPSHMHAQMFIFKNECWVIQILADGNEINAFHSSSRCVSVLNFTSLGAYLPSIYILGL